MDRLGSAKLGTSCGIQRWAFIGLVIGFVVLASVYNVITPVLEAPDEGAHVLYVRHLKESGRLPDLEQGKFQAANESWQPPLYYVLGALLTSGIKMDDLDEFQQWLNPSRNSGTGGSNMYHHRDEIERYPYRGSVLAIHLLRLLSTILGVITILATCGIAYEAFPDRPVIALITSAVAALNPQFLFVSASVNNDNSVTAMCALTLWMLARGWRCGMTWKVGIVLGMLSGLAALSKTSALALLPLIGLSIILWAVMRRSGRAMWSVGLTFAGAWIAVCSWWFLHNWMRYGDPLAWDRMLMSVQALVREQPLSLWETLKYAQWLQRSYWGVFGYGVLLPLWIYSVLSVLVIVGVLGWAIQLARIQPRDWLRGKSKQIMLGLIVWFGLVSGSLFRWMRILTATNQGRLIFPAIPAISLGLVVGWRGWIRLARPLRWLAFGALCWLTLIAVLSPFFVIRPAYTHPRFLAAKAEADLPNRVDLSFGEQIELVGYDNPASVKPGGTLPVTLYWRATDPITENYKVAVHVLGRDYSVVGGIDTLPYGGRYSTLLWKPGKVFKDVYRLSIAGDAQPSLGKVFVAIYPRKDPSTPLSVSPSGNRHVKLGRFKIVPARPVRVTQIRPVRASFGGQIALQGTDAIPLSLRAGDTLRFTLYWRARAKMPQDYTLFVHVLDQAGNVSAQWDAMPLEGWYPTSIWDQGEIIRDRRSVPLPEDLDPGVYRIVIGWYLLATGERLPVVDDRGREIPDRALVMGTLQVQ